MREGRVISVFQPGALSTIEQAIVDLREQCTVFDHMVRGYEERTGIPNESLRQFKEKLSNTVDAMVQVEKALTDLQEAAESFRQVHGRVLN